MKKTLAKKTFVLLFILFSILSIASVSFDIKNFDLSTEQKISIALEHDQYDIGANAAEIIIKLYNFNNYDTLISSLTYSFENNDDEDIYDDDFDDNYDHEYYDDDYNENTEDSTDNNYHLKTPEKKEDPFTIIQETGFDKLLLSLKENLNVIKNIKNIKVNLSNEAAIQFQKKLFSNDTDIYNEPISFDYRDFKLLSLLTSLTNEKPSNNEFLNDLDKVLNQDNEENFNDIMKKYLNKKAFEQFSSMFNEIANLDPEGNTDAFDIINNYLKVFAKNDGEENWLSLKDIFKTNIFDPEKITKNIDEDLNQLKFLLKESFNIYDFENNPIFLNRKNKDFTDILLNKLSIENNEVFKKNKLTYLLDYDLNKKILSIKVNEIIVKTPLEILKELYNSLPYGEFNLYIETKEKNVITKTNLYCNFLKLKSNFEFTDLNLKVSPDIIRYTIGIIFSSLFKNLDDEYLYLLPDMFSLITRDNNDLIFSVKLKDYFILSSRTPNFFSKENIEKIINDFNSPDELTPTETSTNSSETNESN
ncbi:hypothetical protein OSSY52_06720 [Tepiditoga spiralis]|uniref:Uncharacterized protein n=1 Tax=Tepiditoga spiralis TaxID=2108365 RepID=A0A7G1G2H6_9BACT|nr:hypothetical protein [Tepiditoga spiralis]BBE30531.1 hypothetical protein OSSY52_06720 [Tepiditoga spiralis]